MEMKTVFQIVLCVIFVSSIQTLTSEEETEVTDVCCSHGESIAIKLSSVQACSGAGPPEDIEPEELDTCLPALKSCCEKQYKEKDACTAGIKLAPDRCSTPDTDIGKTCCDECSFGRLAGESQGKESCGSPFEEDVSPTTALRKNAYYQCCVKAAEKPETTTKLTTTTEKKILTTTEKKIETTTEKKVETTTEKKKEKCKKDSCEHICEDESGVIRCQCREGFRLQPDKKSCKDINECAEALDDLCLAEGTVCHNVPGTFKCVPIKKRDVGHSCPPGFKRNILNQVCDDINECQLPRPPCPKYLCENTIGGYKCAGKPGKPFEEAVPGAKTESSVTTTASPKNDICPPGFRAGPDDECIDINECEEKLDDCQRLSQYCINTHGNFFCQDHVSKRCAPGFKVNGATGVCEDIDECEENLEVCKRTEVCVNFPGAYDCKSKISTLPKLTTKKCQEGTRLRPGGSICEDIDECREGTHLCDQFQNCINTFGAHECRCKNGFELDSTSGSCVDIDECAMKLDNCLPPLNCLNILGSFTCTRRAGSTTTTTSTAPPLYEYEYYDTEDEADTNPEPVPTTSTTTSTTTTSTTTRKPTTTSSTTTTSTTTPRTPRPGHPYSRYPDRPRYYPTTPITTSTTRRPATTPKRPYDTSRDRDVNPRRPEDVGRRPYGTGRRPEDNSGPTENSPHGSENIPRRSEDPRRPEDYPRRPDNPRRPDSSRNPGDSRHPYDPRRPEYPRRSEEPHKPDSPNNPEDTRKPYDPRLYEYPRRPEFVPRRPDSPTRRPETTPSRPNTPVEVAVPVPKDPEVIEKEKDPEGSYGINTDEIPKNRWTSVVGRDRPDDTPESVNFDANEVHCLYGYEKDASGNCIDLNECEGRHICSNMEECVNKPGGYSCECMTGFRRDESGWCAVITTSSTTTTTSTTTSTTTEGTTAITTPEWPYTPARPRGNRVYPPIICELGYTFDNSIGKCVDIDECKTNTATCSSKEDCVNIEGGFKCVCGAKCRGEDDKPTYSPTIPSLPRQPSESGNTNVITVGAQYGQRGPWSLRPTFSRLPDNRAIVSSCPWGYKLTSEKRCLDIDECATSASECGPMQRCENFYGGYSCQCPTGHKLVGRNDCDDIDECKHGNPCSYNAECVNSVGSYRCVCGDGFRNAPSNDKVCVDVDECTESPAICQQGCANAWGGYRCYCKRGYRLQNDNRTCEDINECEEWSSSHLRGKLCGGECINEPGSYRCSCPKGYRLSEDARSCIDIDECENGEATCAHSSDPGYVCQNTRGGYHCHHIDCPPGYRLESKHRCSRIQRSCPIGDWECLQKPSTYSYNFITFVANIYLHTGSVDLFTMHGPAWQESIVSFEMRMINVQASPGVQPADLSCFDMRPSGNVCAISLLCSLGGPQVAELELTMSLYQRGQFAGSAVARLILIVSEYEF